MFKRRPLGEERRFIGTGNTWVGDEKKYRGWKLLCPCGVSKLVTSHNAGGSMPPHVILKKFREAGWLVAKSSADDLCPKCYRDYLLSRRDQRATAPNVIAEAKLMPAAVNLATANHRPVDPIPIKNKAHELALLAQIAADDYDHALLNQALAALVELCAVLPDEAFEADKEKELRILKSIGYDVNKDPNYQRVADNAPLPIAAARRAEAKMSEVDFDKWLSEQQLTHNQKQRSV